MLKKIILLSLFPLLSGFSACLNVAQAEMMDKVLVIVNEQVITQQQFDYRKKNVLSELSNEAKQKPLPDDFDAQLLESMISDLLQLQEAERRGITVTDEELETALERFAQQQNKTIDELKAGIIEQGGDPQQFKAIVKSSLILSRLREFYARARVKVPDYEIDGFIVQNKMEDTDAEYLIAHILIKDPENNKDLAEQALKELQQGVEFEKVASTYSQATDAKNGGVIGWRNREQLPDIYYSALKNLNVGEVTQVLQSVNGLHILKLIDFKGHRENIVQHKVRHILVSADTEMGRKMAAKKLSKLRSEISNGRDFSELARMHSDDSASAALGGSLDWVSPGQMVPEFEQKILSSDLDEVSEPFNTQYGVHILQVLERRDKNITDEMMRFKAGDYLRRKRVEREFSQWIRELKEQAFIEYVAQPS